jgi:hypothetical protein
MHTAFPMQNIIGSAHEPPIREADSLLDTRRRRASPPRDAVLTFPAA